MDVTKITTVPVLKYGILKRLLAKVYIEMRFNESISYVCSKFII